jgi:hypothetical protein
VVAGGQAGVGGHHRGEPVGVLRDQAEPDQPAPVLSDQRDVVQVQLVEGQRADPLDVPGVAVVGDACRLVGAPEADQVRGDRADPGIREHPDHVAVEERPARLTVQQQRHRPV